MTTSRNDFSSESSPDSLVSFSFDFLFWLRCLHLCSLHSQEHLAESCHSLYVQILCFLIPLNHHFPLSGPWRTFSVFLMPLSFPNAYSRHPNAVYTGGVSSQYILFKYPQWVLPHWVSYSWHLMPLPDTEVQVICLYRQSDPLNCLPNLAFWLPCTIYMVGCFLTACPCPRKTPFGPPSCQTIFLSRQPDCFQIAHLNRSSDYFVLYPQ